MLRYTEWCLNWDTENRKNPHKEGIGNNRIVETVTQKLITRMNFVLDKYYGDKHFLPIGKHLIISSDIEKSEEYGIAESYELFEKWTKEIKDQKNICKDRKNAWEEVNKQTLNSFNQTSIDKREKARYEYEESRKELKRLKQEIGAYPLGSIKRFRFITKEEKEVFEFLLDNEKYKILVSKKYNKESVKCRREFVSLLYEVIDLPWWELCERDIQNIVMKFNYPAVEKMVDIYNRLADGDE